DKIATALRSLNLIIIVLYAVDPLRMCATDRKTHIRVLIFPTTRNIAQLSRGLSGVFTGPPYLARFDSKSFLKRNGPSVGDIEAVGSLAMECPLLGGGAD